MYHRNSILKGYLCIRITGSSCERFLFLCTNHQIILSKIKGTQNHYTAFMKASDFLKIKRLVKKTGVHVSIIQKYGLPFFLRQHRKHKCLLLGWIWCCFFLFLLSVHIWRIDINGNSKITREQIMSYLSDTHVGYGTPKYRIDCKQMASDIRAAFPDLTWVAVKKQGTMLEIDLKENTDSNLTISEQFSDSEVNGSSLIANYDGTITEIITRKGIPKVTAGQKVKKGDILVSGEIPVTNDENEVIATEYVNADADIILNISGTYTDCFSRSVKKTVYPQKEKIHFYIKIFGQYFFQKDDREEFADSEILTEEKQLTLFSDFYLPVIFGVVRIHPCDTKTVFLSEEDAKKTALLHLDKFIKEKKEKGVQILKKNVRIDTGVTVCKCICTYQAYVSDHGRIPAITMAENQEGNIS